MSKNIFKVVMSLGAVMHVIGFFMGVFQPATLAQEFGAMYSDNIYKITTHLALFFFVVAVIYFLSAVWAFKNKAEGFQLGIVLGLVGIANFMFDIFLVGSPDFVLLAIGVLPVLTGFLALKDLRKENNAKSV